VIFAFAIFKVVNPPALTSVGAGFYFLRYNKFMTTEYQNLAQFSSLLILPLKVSSKTEFSIYENEGKDENEVLIANRFLTWRFLKF